MIKLKEIICCPSPPPSPYPFQVLSPSQSPSNMPSLWLLPLPSLSTIHFPLLLPLLSLYLCHCYHVLCFCRCNCCCHCPLFFCPRTDCRLFAIIVWCSYLLTFPRLFTFQSLLCNKLEPDPWPWWWHACRAARTSWYRWRHQPWSIPQPPGEPGELCSAFAGHSFWTCCVQSLGQDPGRGLSWWGDLYFFGTFGSPLEPAFLGASGEAFTWQSPFAQPLVQPLWLNDGVEVLPQ
jgi:hypothetical protein